MSKKDIVSRLRECDEGLLEECQTPELGDIVTDFSSIADAANLIEQLRERIYLLRKQRAERDTACGKAAKCIETLTDNLKVMQEERDYARRWVCEVLANPSLITGIDKPGDGTKRAFAKEQAWDCFYEENHNA